MKKRFLYISLMSLFLATGCTDKFEEINTDPTKVPAGQFEPNSLLSRAEYNYANTGYSQFLFQSMWAQLLSSTFGYYSNGDKYVGSGSLISYQDRLWAEDYVAASNAYEMTSLSTAAGYTNLANIGVIMKVLIMQHVTDCYGDVPYSEALKGKSGVYTTAYDPQSFIYTSMLRELDSSIALLDATKDIPTSDIIYGGDIAKWKKFGYSLMLRTAMRLTKVDATLAQQYVEKAVAGGVFTSNADNAYSKVDNTAGFSNANTNVLLVQDDYREVKWSKVLIDMLRKSNDPRLSIIGEIPPNGLAANNDGGLSGSSDSSIQQGMPNGYTLNNDATSIVNAPGYPGASPAANASDNPAPLGRYSRPTNSIYRNVNNIQVVLTYGEVELLLAEAAVRGWNVGGTAITHYASGVSAAMQAIAAFNSSTGNISATTAATYAATHPLDVTSTAASLKMINEQYWILNGTMLNFIEAWCNWRRSGYPVLTPVVFSGNFSGGTIPRRIPYHSGEAASNATSYAAAVKKMGGDNFTNRVWWDAQ